MKEASYPRLALLLQFICLAIYMASSHALPTITTEKQNQTAITIEQNIQNLVDILTADTYIEYSKSMMVACYIAVDHGDHDLEHFHEYPLSSNISDFRDIRCVFRYGGPQAYERRSLFQVQNQWPLHWDRWETPSGGFYWPLEVLPFSWRKAVSYMSAERADRLLKAYGKHGPYQLVAIETTKRNPDGAWRFLNVQISDHDGGGQRTYFVDVRTGRIDETG